MPAFLLAEFIKFYTEGAGSKDLALKEMYYIFFEQSTMVDAHRNATQHAYVPLLRAIGKWWAPIHAATGHQIYAVRAVEEEVDRVCDPPALHKDLLLD